MSGSGAQPRTVSALPAPLRVVHIITSTQVGGAETQLAHLIRCSDPAQLDQRVICLEPLGKLAPLMEKSGARVESLELSNGAGAFLKGLVRLRARLRGIRPDVVHTWMYHADLLGLLAAKSSGLGLPVLWSLRCSNLDLKRYSRSTRLVVRACRFLSFWPDLIAANSRAGRDWHIGLGYPAPKLRVAPNGYDTQRFAPDAAAREQCRAELGLSAGHLLLGHVGRFDPAKDHACLLAAFERLVGFHPQARLLLIGQGLSPDNPAFAACERPPLAGRCHLLGPRSDVERWYSAMDLYVSSSISEGLPNAVAEAMSCAVLPVVSDAGDSRYLVDNTGLVAPAGDAAELARALQKAAELPAPVRRVLGLAARERIQRHYSLEIMLQTTLELYAGLLG